MELHEFHVISTLTTILPPLLARHPIAALFFILTSLTLSASLSPAALYPLLSHCHTTPLSVFVLSVTLPFGRFISGGLILGSPSLVPTYSYTQ
jgi:hypothetical protein